MPYALPSDAAPGTTGVQLRIDTPRRFYLTTPFRYAPDKPLPPELDVLLPPSPPAAPPDRRWLQIERGRTDLGTVPGVLWGLVASYGRHTLAVLVHDHLVGLAEAAPPGERFLRRAAADEAFYDALRDPDAGEYRSGWFRSLVLWTGVSTARYFLHHRPGFGVLAGATVGAWLPGLWLVENLGGRSLPIAAWILLLAGLALLAVAGLTATRLGRLQPHGLASSPAHTAAAPTALQAAASFPPGRSGIAARLSDAWVVRAMVAGAVVLLLGAAWVSMPWPPLFGVGVPGWLAMLGLLAFVGGSVVLALSTVRRDGLLPLICTVAVPSVGLVALVTVAVLYVLWVPDAFGRVCEGPINLIERRASGGGHAPHQGDEAAETQP